MKGCEVVVVGGMSNFLFFSNPIFFDKSKDLTIEGVMLDTIKIDESLLDFLESKSEWGYETILLGEFANSLEAGNVSNGGLQIDYLKLKKRKKDELTWQDIKIFKYNPEVKRYNFEDRLVESIEKYEYSIQPITSDILGSESIEEIYTEFKGIWIVGDKNAQQLIYNTEISEIKSNISQNIVTTLGSRYPFLIKNGSINYREFTVQGKLVSKETAKGQGIDKYEEKKLRNTIMKFLEDGKPKIIKDNSGNYILCQIVDSPILKPINDLNRSIYDISFNVVEIGDAYDEDTLLQYGLIKSEDITIEWGE